MFHAAYKVGLAALLVGAFLFTSHAQAQDKRRPIKDEAGLFSKEAKEQANKVISALFEKHNKELIIETVKTAPVAAETNKEERDKWAMERFNDLKVDGVYIVFCKEPSFYRIRVGNETRKTAFAKQDIPKLETIINEHRKQNDYDLALTNMVAYVQKTIATNTPAAVAKQPKVVENPVQQPAPVRQPVRAQNVEDKGMPPWVGWVCMIIGVLLVIWVIFAIIRAMTGMMGGGYGHGGMGGGYGGGGGGGFLTGLLGGMFGAMAGMWMYNTFFGGHANYSTGDWGGGNNQGGGWGDKQGDFGDKEGGEKGDYQGDTDNDAGGGGDDDAGAGGGGGDDAGGGGGDWGDAGGGDAGGGGGGDWGGGGGDAGGGGGGGCGGAGCGGGGGD